MHTAHSLTVSPSMLCSWGCLPGPGGPAWSWGGCLPGLGGACLVLEGCLPGTGGGCLVPGGCGIPACTEAEPPSPLRTESEMPMKILPCPNFIAGGKNTIFRNESGRLWLAENRVKTTLRGFSKWICHTDAHPPFFKICLDQKGNLSLNSEQLHHKNIFISWIFVCLVEWHLPSQYPGTCGYQPKKIWF